MCPQLGTCQQVPGGGTGTEQVPPLNLQKMRILADTPILDFWRPELCEEKLVLSQATQLCDSSLRQPRGTHTGTVCTPEVV